MARTWPKAGAHRKLLLRVRGLGLRVSSKKGPFRRIFQGSYSGDKGLGGAVSGLGDRSGCVEASMGGIGRLLDEELPSGN